MKTRSFSAEVPNPAGLAEWFYRRALRGSGRPAITYDGMTLSYGNLQAKAECLSAVLQAGGVKAGDRVAFLGFNHPLVLVTLFASARIGAIFIPLNFRLTRHELEFIINDAGVHTLIVDADHCATIDLAKATLPCKRYLRSGTGTTRAGWEQVETLMDEVSNVPPAVDVLAGDVAAIMYTSGTTGQPKGAMLTHGNLWANNINWMLAVDYASDDTVLNCAPLFHVGGLCVTVLPTLLAGGHVVLQRSFVAEGFLRAIKRHRVSVAFAVPAMLLAVTQLSSFNQADLSSLRLIIAGGAPVPEPLLRLFNGRGIPLSQGFGMTESASAVTFLEAELAMSKLGSCGKATALSEIHLIDETGAAITAPDVKGEICMRGENVTPGYWNRPQATAEALDKDGWFRSGDIGYLDADGYLYVCDRLKDMIISGGENIYPAEIESVLYAHPAVVEVAVVGAPDDRWGERAVAFVAVKPGALLSFEEMQSFAADHLARYKLPRELRLVDALPRNSNGKVQKTELRQRCKAT